MSQTSGPTNYAFVRSKDHSWVPAIVTSNNGRFAEVKIPQFKKQQAIKCDGGASAARGFDRQTIDLSDYPNNALPLQNVNDNGSLNEIPDMVHMPFLHEAGILYNLKARHIEGKPYTRAGDVIIAVNPYQWMMEYYSPKRMNQYSDALVWDFENAVKADPRKHLDPHVYEVSALAYRGLAINGDDQSILVSGESGAGKTETVKICLNHIASVQQGPKSNVASASPIVQKVLDSNPLLEAFGNAKTRRNDNSSRFGKYLQLQFDTEHPTKSASSSVPVCALAGSKCETYLLEKCRVVAHEHEERTFHIFYQLLAAPDRIKSKIWDGLVGKTKESYSYVGWSNTDKIEGMTDASRWNETLESLELVGVKGAGLKALMRAICVVLQLGNITFQSDPRDSDRSVIANSSEMESLATLMGVPGSDLEKALTVRNMSVKGETCIVHLNATKAKESCDAFAKEIYSKTFLWLVRTINDSTCAEQNYTARHVDKYGIIGLLDIFGFESFDNNRFEQLCINYANEKLQQKFNNDMFKAVQAEYELEGVPLEEIKYDDNAEVVQLIEGRMGLLDVLNDECYRPQGSDEAFVLKAVQQNKRSRCLMKPKHSRRVDFGIQHYAGDVMYDATDFVTTNMDTLPTDLQALACKSSNTIIAKELSNDSMTNVKSKPVLRRLSASQRGPSNIVAPTVWTKYKDQLCALMATLHKTQSRYIRCIKPNEDKKPLIMEHASTVEQLRCAGVIAAITISRSAFPNRMDQSQVLDRFKHMWSRGQTPTSNPNHSKEIRRNDCDRLLTPNLRHMEQFENGRKIKAFVLGNNKVYFRGGALEHLEAERLKNVDEWAQKEAQEAQKLEEERKRKERLEAEAQKKAEEDARRRAERAAELARLQAEKAAEEVRKRAERQAEEERLRQEREIAMQREAAEAIERAMRKEAAAQERIRRKAANERREALERERAAQEEQHNRDVSNLWNQIRELQDRVIEAQNQHKVDIEIAEERRAQQVEEQRELLEEERRSLENARSGQQLSPAQESSINEKGKIIEYLRRENARLMATHEKVSSDVTKLQRNTDRLVESNEKAQEALASLHDNAQHQNNVHLKLRNNEQVYKQQVSLIKTELRNRDKYLKNEDELLRIFQRGMSEIMDMIHEHCTQNDVIEDAASTEEAVDAQAKAKLIGIDVGDFSIRSNSSSSTSAHENRAVKQPQTKSIESYDAAPDITETEMSESDDFDDDEDEYDDEDIEYANRVIAEEFTDNDPLEEEEEERLVVAA